MSIANGNPDSPDESSWGLIWSSVIDEEISIRKKRTILFTIFAFITILLCGFELANAYAIADRGPVTMTVNAHRFDKV